MIERPRGAIPMMCCRSLAILSAAAVLSTLSAGCDSILDVDPPDRVPTEQLGDPATATLQVESVVASFDCAYAQYIVTTGEVSDELVNSNLASSQAFQFDARSITPDNENYSLFECEQYNAIYLPLSLELTQARQAMANLENWTNEQVTDRAGLMATTLAYGGYGRVLLGEAFCSAAIDLGPELTSEEILAQAEDQFTRAIDLAGQTGDDQILNLARVGRARVRRDLGDETGALADARAVPEGFVHEASFSSVSVRSMNQVFRVNNQNQTVSIDPGYRNLTYEGIADPRVPVRNTGQMGSGQIFQVWEQLKYGSLDAAIPIASWDEAQLIIAELEGGQDAIDIINEFHDRAGLPEFESDDEAEIQAHVRQERARELFLEGQRMWDVRRFEIPLDPVPGTAYPKGGTYGDMRCFPLPNAERNNNPNL